MFIVLRKHNFASCYKYYPFTRAISWMLQRRHLHASEVALVVKFGAYTVIFKNILYLKMVSLRSNPVLTYLLCGKYLHCKCFDHKNYEDCRGLCREDLHYLWKRVVRIAGFLHNCRVSLQFLQPFSIDSADFRRWPWLLSLVLTQWSLKIFCIWK